jgi:hypothetical protein
MEGSGWYFTVFEQCRCAVFHEIANVAKNSYQIREVMQ